MVKQPSHYFDGFVDGLIGRDAAIRQLERQIVHHDCHLSADEGCECLFWKEKINELKNIPKYEII